MRISVMTKAIVGMAATITGAIAATFPDSALGKVCVVLAAGLGAFVTVYLSKNTQTVTTGTTDGPVTVGTMLSDSGAVIGDLTADTGALTGGVVAGTTGILGGLLDATVGKLLPGGDARHAA